MRQLEIGGIESKKEGGRMKAFFIGLIFLIAVGILTGAAFLLYPLIIVLSFFLQILLALLFVIFSIWLLGKFIIFIWESIFKKSEGGAK